MIANFQHGQAKTTGEVTVQRKCANAVANAFVIEPAPSVGKERQRRPIEDELSSGKAPGFTIPLINKKSKEGEQVVFECLPYGEQLHLFKFLYFSLLKQRKNKKKSNLSNKLYV